MNFQKILLKIAYWLVAFSIFVLLGLMFFSSHLSKKQAKGIATQNHATQTTDTDTNINFSGMSVTIDDKIAKKEVAEIKEAIEKETNSNATQDK